MALGKGRRAIVVAGVEYQWQATGSDGVIGVTITPRNGIGPKLLGYFGYHSTSAGDQVVVTPRLVRRAIEYAIAERGYDPLARGKEIQLQRIDDLIQWEDAVRAVPPSKERRHHGPTPGATP